MSYPEGDYVPGAVSDADYTEQDVPYKTPDEKIEDESFDADFLGGTTAEAIDKQSFRFMPPGIHVVEIRRVEWADKGGVLSNTVYVKRSDGTVSATNFDSRKCKVTFSLPGDENCTTQDQFLLPPARSQLEAYEYGFKEEKDALDPKKKRDQGGFWAKKLKHFLSKIGFINDANGNLPPEAGKFINWMFYVGTNTRRLVRIDIQPGKPRDPYFDKETNQMVTPRIFNQIRMFSYSLVPPPVGQPTGASHQKSIQQSAQPVTTNGPEKSAKGKKSQSPQV